MTKPKQPTGMPDMSLVEKAKSLGRKLQGRKPEITEADIALALAWARGDVTMTQCVKVWGFTTSGAAYVKIAMALRKYILETDL